MEALFSHQPFRKQRLLLMVVLSGLFHVSLVGLAAVWLRPDTSPSPVKDTSLEFDGGLITSSVAAPLIAPDDAPAPAAAVSPGMPPPQDVPPADETAPPSSDPDMTEPPAPKKQAMPKAARAAAAAPANANRGAVAAVSSRAIGSPSPAGSGAVPARLSKPPYPHAARVAHLQGSGLVRITFDALGRVSSAAIVQSVGSAILDDNTLSYARSYWQGPPNTTATFPITYRLDQ